MYELRIDASTDGYQLSLGKGSSVLQQSQNLPVSTLATSPPVGGAFTGMMFGLYAFGKGEPCLDPADFSRVSCETAAAGN